MEKLKTYRLLFVLPVVFLFLPAGRAQDFRLTSSPDPAEARWVDSLFSAMTPEERLGQLFMIRAHSDLGADHISRVEQLIERYHVGGLCFFQGTPEKQVELVNRYQALSERVPLLVAIDGEWGLGMRMKESTISFPRQQMLGAIQNNRLIYDMGQEIARQMRRVGVTVNFAPDADVNNNAANPVINTRSFGEDRYNVAVKSYMYMKGMQDHGVMACAKHFPGHGDTNVDSHLDLPVIPHSRQRLDSIELYPFRALADYGVGSVMIAHLHVPALDDRPNRPTSLSRNTVTGLLKESLGFKGLIFTDALEMKGVTKNFTGGQVEAEALLAGVDVLALPENIEASMQEINRYLQAGKLSQADLDERVRKVLRAKYRLGLQRYEPQAVENVRAELNTPAAVALKRSLIREALTLVRNDGDIVPFGELDSLRLASLSIGASAKTPFQQRLDSYGRITHRQASKNLSDADRQSLVAQFRSYDAVIVSLHNLSSQAGQQYGITEGIRNLLADLAQQTRVVLVVFGSPYALRYFDDVGVVLEAYEEDSLVQDEAAQALFGVFGLRGRLPVTASLRASFNMGVLTRPNFRLGYAAPEEVNMDSDTLRQIKALVEKAVEARGTPGGVVLVAKNGEVVYEEAFGYQTYDEDRPVHADDAYDLASLTKVLGTTLAIMKLQEEGKVDLDAPMVTYLPELAGSNKADLHLRDVMAHHAGLIGWIPFYKQTLNGSRRNPQPSSAWYRSAPGGAFTVPVTERLYLREDFVDKIWDQIIHSELLPTRGYKYSDLGFYLMARMVQRLTGQSLDAYLEAAFYRPLGLRTATFRPWEHLPLDQVAPTEEDRYWRRQQVHGYVHDMGAAMLGGVSGHAGLFANAHDVAVILQMLLQEGYYGGRRFLQPETIREFTTRYPGSTRRGLGFDMFQLDTRYSPNLSPLASKSTFGHTGFTGSCAWADPENDLVFVFLTNRTYPSMNNYRYNRLKTRDRAQSVAYRAIRRPEEQQLAYPHLPIQEELPQLPGPAPVVVRSQQR